MKALHEWIVTGAISKTIAEQRGYKELVRCRDCKKYNTLKCSRCFTGDTIDYWKQDKDWYCADGERGDD